MGDLYYVYCIRNALCPSLEENYKHLYQFIAKIVIQAALSNIAVNEDNSIVLYWSVVSKTEYLILSYKWPTNASSYWQSLVTYVHCTGNALCLRLGKIYDAFVSIYCRNYHFGSATKYSG